MCSSWCPLCFTQLSIYKLRLTDLESQDALCKMLLDASAGLADCRRIMSNIVVGEDTTWTQVQLCLDKAKPFVTAYKKHIQTARSLLLDSAYRCLHYTCICVSVCVCACVSCRYAPCLSEDPVQQTRCRSRQEESQDGRPRGVSGTSVSFLPARGHMQVGALACACIATLNIAACFKRFECRRMPCISLNVGQGQRGAWDPL